MLSFALLIAGFGSSFWNLEQRSTQSFQEVYTASSTRLELRGQILVDQHGAVWFFSPVDIGAFSLGAEM